MTIKSMPVNIPSSIAKPNPAVGADAMLAQVKQGIAGIKDRIAGLDQPIVPAAYVGPTPALVFNAESNSFTCDILQDNGAGVLANYIVRSGATYNLPVVVGGNGIFLAHKVRIVVRQRLSVNISPVVHQAQAVVFPMVNGFQPSNAIFWTTKFSCWPTQPAVLQGPSINYRWNIQDPVTGFNYSDQLIPAAAVLNRNFVNMVVDDSGSSAMLFDGDWHEFDSPWRFDQAYKMNVLWRPLTDIIQVDSSISGTASPMFLPYDDRVNGKRNQAVYVQVEFQGERVGGS